MHPVLEDTGIDHGCPDMLEEARPAFYSDEGSLEAFSGDIHPRSAFVCPGDCFRRHGDPVGVWLWRSADRRAPAAALHATAGGRAVGGAALDRDCGGGSGAGLEAYSPAQRRRAAGSHSLRDSARIADADQCAPGTGEGRARHPDHAVCGLFAGGERCFAAGA